MSGTSKAMVKRVGSVFRAGFLAACIGLVGWPGSVAAGKLQRLEIDTASGAHLFKVEVMRSEAERGRGLMYRKSLPKGEGMLFDFREEQPVVFWMKNTLIPLDMIFVARDGHVVSVKHDAKPMDETLISSGGLTLGVVELNAGQANAIGVKAGDTVKHPIFEPQAASGR